MSKIPLNRGDLQKLQIFPLIPNQPYLNEKKKKKKTILILKTILTLAHLGQ